MGIHFGRGRKGVLVRTENIICGPGSNRSVKYRQTPYARPGMDLKVMDA